MIITSNHGARCLLWAGMSFLLAACGGPFEFVPEAPGRYVLESIDGDALPVFVPGGGSAGKQAQSGTLALRKNGTFTDSLYFRFYGALHPPEGTLVLHVFSGTWERTGIHSLTFNGHDYLPEANLTGSSVTFLNDHRHEYVYRRD